MIIIGHRGARGLAPENSLVAITKALSANVDMIEIDIRVTKDDVVILHHDEFVNLNDKSLNISDSTYKGLLEVKGDIPTLAEAFEFINGKTKIYLDIKKNTKLTPVIKVIQKYLNKAYNSDDIYLASFDQNVLMKLHKALPDLPTIVIGSWSGVRTNMRARQLETKNVAMNQRWLWWGFIRSVSSHGYNLFAYTLDDPKKAKAWQKHGLYAVITDYPDRF